MATISRNDLLKLGFEDEGGPVINDYQQYIVLRYYIHKDRPWIRIEEHYPKQYLDHMDKRHIVSTVINYGTKDGEIVYSSEEVKRYLLHHRGLPNRSH
ncbi:hypothetical protein GCM10023231_02020 [Olivibacter ginsenosidimutans]|uniref:Uncharacterized protein n=1 Tax=Olivibacter ginsenosidimutans TaxID=1176537 RepID=A0ABP9ACY3_9SPHI